MKVAIHQPNYLPWIGFFDKLDQVDTFVILDKAKYSKTGYVNRNKIKTPQGELLLTVPIKGKNRPINELNIDQETNWQRRHWKIIEANYRKSNFWGNYRDGFEQIFNQKWEKLSLLNITFIKHICTLLNVHTEILLESSFHTDFGSGNMRNVNIVKHVKGAVYLSGVGARVYNDESEFHAHEICLQYQQFNHPKYPQRFGEFIPNLSIIDMLFNCGSETMDIIRSHRK